MLNVKKRYLHALLILLMQAACQSIKEEDEVEMVTVLQVGKSQTSFSTLPIYTPIYVEEKHENLVKASRLGFKGFDFDHNGTFEMVEVMNKAGVVVGVLYDFDFDGQVDRIDDGSSIRAEPAAP